MIGRVEPFLIDDRAVVLSDLELVEGVVSHDPLNDEEKDKDAHKKGQERAWQRADSRLPIQLKPDLLGVQVPEERSVPNGGPSLPLSRLPTF